MKWYYVLGASLVGVWLYVMFVHKPGGAKVTPPSVKGPGMSTTLRVRSLTPDEIADNANSQKV